MKLRVLHCIYDDPRNPWVAGGGAVRVFEIYRRLTAEVEATVITGNHPDASDSVREGVRYTHLGSPAPYAWSRLTYARAASRWLRDAQYDVAVVDFSGYTPVVIPRHRPVVVTVHHLTGPNARQRWGLLIAHIIGANERRMLRRARRFTATSAATYDILGKIVPSSSRVDLVHAGVPDDLFDLPRREGDFILYFGRLDWHQKGLDTLLSAAAIITSERPDIQLRIAGRGRDAVRVEDEISRLGIESNVQMIGPVDEAQKRALLSEALLLLMPSRFEGFGMVAAEAMGAGVPVIATDAGSLPEVVDPPSGGVLVSPGDAEALAAAAIRLLGAPEERARLSQSARISAARFRWDVVAREHLAVLQDTHFASSSAR